MDQDGELELQPMELNVRTPEGDIIKLAVHPSNTIRDMKERVVNEIDDQDSPDDIRLLYKGKELDNTPTLIKDCKIPHGSILDMRATEIKVKKPNGRVIKVPVRPKRIQLATSRKRLRI